MENIASQSLQICVHLYYARKKLPLLRHFQLKNGNFFLMFITTIAIEYIYSLHSVTEQFFESETMKAELLHFAISNSFLYKNLELATQQWKLYYLQNTPRFQISTFSFPSFSLAQLQKDFQISSIILPPFCFYECCTCADNLHLCSPRCSVIFVY